MARARLALGLALTLTGACTEAPEVRVVGTRELGPLEAPPIVASRERGYSVVGFGRSIWLFGDTTLTSPDADGSTLRSNGWATTPDLGAENGVEGFAVVGDAAGGPAELFVRTAEEIAADEAAVAAGTAARTVLWPLSAVRDDVGDRLLLFYAKRQASAVGNLSAVGTGIAVWSDLEFGPIRPVLDGSSDEPTLLFRAPEPEFGQALLVEGETLYAYGCRDELYHPCALARVPVAEVFTRSAWEFWTGRGWSPEVDEAVALVEAAMVLSVTRNFEVDRYLLYYGVDDPGGGGELLVRAASAPEGPWSEPVSLLRVDEGTVADVIAHPEYRRGGGTFELLSYRVDAQTRLLEVELAPGG